MARCFAFSARPASVVLAVLTVISGLLPVCVSGTDARKCGTRRLVQHLYSTPWRSGLGRFPRFTLLGMGTSYHQFCPVAKAMELLDERWTLLIVRELVAGSERFNELRRGVPRMYATLLSRRLGRLLRGGVGDGLGDGNDVRYVLPPAGRELQPVVEALGVWGIRWIGEIGDEDLDPKLRLWDMHRNVAYAAVPPGRTVVQFRFPDVPSATRDWWLVIGSGEARGWRQACGPPGGVTAPR